MRDTPSFLPDATDPPDASEAEREAERLRRERECEAAWALGIPGHSWAVTATGSMSIGHKGMLHAAKAMAIAAASLIEDPDLIRQAREEFAASTAGRPYVCPIPDEVKPPLP